MTNDERKKLYAALSAPFPEEAIERTQGRVTGRGYDTTGIKYQYVVNRLNEVLGIGCWRTEQVLTVRSFTTAKGRAGFDATCDLTLQLGTWSEGKFLPWAEAFATGGHQSMSEADARKGAFTNGLKKAAGMMGCGKQAYEGTLDDDNVPVEGAGPVQAPNPRPAGAAQRPDQASGREGANTAGQGSSRLPQAPPPTNGQRLSQKQLGLLWSLAKRLAYEEAAFRKQVQTRFGSQPEALDARVASGLIGQLTAKASNGVSHPAARP